MVSRTLLSLVAAAALSGCYGYSYGVEPMTVTAAEIEVGPPAFALQYGYGPQIVYEGHPTYYYDNRWYYQDRGRWRYYRSEPAYLRDHRARWEEDRRRHGYPTYGPPGRYQHQQPPPHQQPYPHH